MREDNGNKSVLSTIAEENNLKITSSSPLAGGDINDVHLIVTDYGNRFVVKINDRDLYPGMFRAEREGLEALAQPGVFTIPKVIASGNCKERSYLLLEFIQSSNPVKNFWEIFGQNLAQLHRTTATAFGFKNDNYIGSLPQKNRECSTAAEFYISQRLEPQIKLAKEKGFNTGSISSLYRRCEELIPKEPPALVHGDLWSGNYLTDSQGMPCLIDPAVAFAPREMDLGMMKLFGGFDPALFNAYEDEFPLEEGLDERIPLWQLYYLLVHLNIFGRGYLPRVQEIIKQYS